MARFRLMKAIATGALRFHAGEVVTDTIPLTVATDRHWPGLTASVMASGMVPLDGSASSMKAASVWAGEVLPATILGVDSIG
jgi:hypothetical protein